MFVRSITSPTCEAAPSPARQSRAANGKEMVGLRDEVSPAPRMERRRRRRKVWMDEGPGSPAPRMEGKL